MRKLFSSVALLAIMALLGSASVFASSSSSVKPENWIAVDGLGRSLNSYGNTKAEQKNHERYVGIFYHTWHSQYAQSKFAVNVTDFIKQYPEASDVNNPVWNQHNAGNSAFFWNEPLFGYYRSQDEYVIRKHAELLADAGVDFIFFDCTNGYWLWEKGVDAILKGFTEAKADGVNVPKIVFWLNLWESENRVRQLQNMYKSWYANGEFDDLLFYKDGKPLVFCYTDVLNQEYELKETIESYFTFQQIQPSYFHSEMEDYWGWLSVYPQCKYGGYTEDGRPVQMAVSVAQNVDYKNSELTSMGSGDTVMGRSYAANDYFYSYTYGGKKYVVDGSDVFSRYAGRNFQQQWDYAIKCDPNYILVTGWNEWTGLFDQFNDEYSRDCEPSKGELKDHFYNQLAANIRKYKGIKAYVNNGADQATINIYSADFSQWDAVSSYNHYTNSTKERHSAGYRTTKYENNTMRNDIITAKVAYDTQNLYFYVSTAEPLTPETDPGWMRLFLDTDYTGNSENWEGFEYVINRINPSDGSCILEKSKGVSEEGIWQWEKVGNDGEIRYTVNGSVLQISVPRKLLGFEGEEVDFGFKWSDNMQVEGDIMDFYINGDAAPGARFCFRFALANTLQGKQDSNSCLIIAVAFVCLAAVLLVIFGMLFYLRKSRKK